MGIIRFLLLFLFPSLALGFGSGITGTTCTPVVTEVNMATAPGKATVGTGTPASCGEAALRSAVENFTSIDFDCGPDPHTIVINSQIEPGAKNLTIDGGGLITLQGGGGNRLFYEHNNGFRSSTALWTFQNIRMIGGYAPRPNYQAQDSQYPDCAYGYTSGHGGAIYSRNVQIDVINAEFDDNEAATIGPDVGGGSIYVTAAIRARLHNVKISNSRGSNGGGAGFLQTTLLTSNVLFENNKATGRGGNNYKPELCPLTFNHDNQVGAGGNGGGLYEDGRFDGDSEHCGLHSMNNGANQLGGGYYRAANAVMRNTITGSSQAKQ